MFTSVSLPTVCYALKEDSTVAKGGIGWSSTFFKITDPSSHRKASSKFVKFTFFSLHFLQLVSFTWYPGLKEGTWYPGLAKSLRLSPRSVNCTAVSRFWQRTPEKAQWRLVEWQRRWVRFVLEKASFLLMIAFWANSSLQLSSWGSMDHRDGAVRHFVGI